ncbi:MAG TPA: helix-turn-helix domain-containing GNAT family N-acetyltransferase [Actinophytocola sp.]|jgi:DNA-binding MarR family transcriptional regulator|nr:helix-turn-helix domain-containing GNAT family N-acetyltransferase [Actinophytocola sp.]
MTAEQIEQVRRFNRLVTQRVGALDDHFLARDRPLGEARLLWEIGQVGDGVDVRRLRARLDLDSGYVSRLLRALEADGLVTVAPGTADRRVRVARLTAAGRRERAALDERADDAAASLLVPLTADQRGRLVAAMKEVDRLLTAALVTIEPVDPDHEHARYCRDAYYAEIDRRFEQGFDPGRSITADGAELRPPAGLLVVAYLRGEPMGCGALRFTPGEPATLKRMWVADAVRGLGIGARLLAELESRAAGHGCDAVRLETNQALTEAIAMYRAAGYVEVAPYNDEFHAHHWFTKRLGTRPSGASRS